MRILFLAAALLMLAAVFSPAAAEDITPYEKGWEGCQKISAARARQAEEWFNLWKEDSDSADARLVKTGWYERNYILIEAASVCEMHLDHAKLDVWKYNRALTAIGPGKKE